MSGVAIPARQRARSGVLAAAPRRAAYLAALAALVLEPRPHDELFDFPAVAHPWALLAPAALVLLALIDLRRPWREQLDLVALLAPLAALAFAGPGRPWSMFLLYPVLAYLAVRMLALSRAGAAPARGLQARLPCAWLAGGIAVLVAVHLAWALAGAIPTDVGVDSVTGALRLLHGRALYAGPAGSDTYGPATFLAYVPFAAALSSANGAARLATVVFTLLAALGLYALGARERGRATGVTLAFVWLALPFTLYEDALGWNDSLVAAALVATLLLARHPARRGAAAALAAWTKLAPLALVPMLAMRRRAEGPLDRRDAARCVAAFAAVSALLLTPALAHDTPATFIARSFGFQAGRAPANSLWAALQGPYARGLPWLASLSEVAHGIAVALAVAAALIVAAARRRQDLAGLAAAGAGLLAAVLIALSYYASSYLLWIAPLALVAVVLGAPAAAPIAD